MTRRGSLLMDTSPLQVLKPLAVRLGINEAVALQQLHYLLQQANGQPVAMTHKEWRAEHLPWLSEVTVRRVFGSLRERKLVVIEQANGADRTARYSIDYDGVDVIEAAYRANEQIDRLDLGDRSVGNRHIDRFHAGATGSPKAEEQQENPLAPFTDEFRGWLSHHWATTSIGQPDEDTDEWSELLWAYAKVRQENFSPVELELAIEGAWHDEWSHARVLYVHAQVLKPKDLRRRVELGRKSRQAAGQSASTTVACISCREQFDPRLTDRGKAGLSVSACDACSKAAAA